MKRSVFRLLTVIAVVGLAVSCGGGGGDDDEDQYYFGGRWATTETVTASTVPGVPVGAVDNDILIIAQNENSVTVQFESIRNECTMQGTGDPKTKTFSASGVCIGDMAGVRIDINGTGIDDDSMSGAYSMSYGGRAVNATYTADLASRSLAISRAGGDADKLGSLLLKKVH